jgi:hypothetical protein
LVRAAANVDFTPLANPRSTFSFDRKENVDPPLDSAPNSTFAGSTTLEPASSMPAVDVDAGTAGQRPGSATTYGRVTAPSEAEETRRAYFASTPCSYAGGGD